jgi:hypothetical protein
MGFARAEPILYIGQAPTDSERLHFSAVAEYTARVGHQRTGCTE